MELHTIGIDLGKTIFHPMRGIAAVDILSELYS